MKKIWIAVPKDNFDEGVFCKLVGYKHLLDLTMTLSQYGHNLDDFYIKEIELE